MTLDGLTIKIEETMSMFAGVDVQTYAETRIKHMIQRQFNNILLERFWFDFLSTDTYTLDGTTGLITGDVTAQIKSFTDIMHIWYEAETDSLPRAPNNLNPAVLEKRCVTPYASASKRFRIYPVDTTGDVTVRFRTKPDDFEADTEIPFDTDLLLYAVVRMFLTEDGTNDNAVKMYNDLYTKRYELLRLAETNIPVALDSYTSDASIYQWR